MSVYYDKDERALTYVEGPYGRNYRKGFKR